MALDLESQIIMNLRRDFDLLFLDNGFFFNVASGQLDHLGNDQSNLTRITNDPDFIEGQVYQSQFKNWVYEEDVAVPSGFTTPTLASGVFVNSVFRLRADLTYGHSIDYPNGRIIFDDPGAVLVTDDVRTDFGVKRVWVDEITKDVIPLINDLIASNPEIQNTSQTVPSGLTLPAVYIERVRTTSDPLQLGGGKISNREINFHILANHINDIKPLSFLLSEREDKTLKLVDWAVAPFPLDEFGDKTSGYTPYRTLQDTTLLNGLFFTAMESRNFPTDLPIEIEIVEGEMEVRRKDA